MKGMSRIVRTVTTLIYGFILVYGLYVIVHGHLTPGGGFQGGAIAASAFALLVVTYGNQGSKELMQPKDVFSLIESTGLVLFVVFAFFGLGVTFFYNSIANSGGLFGNSALIGVNPGDLNTGGTVPLMNMAVGLEVIAAFGVIILTMSAGSEITRKKEKS